MLSIDWDYFMNASAEVRANLFPECGNEDLPFSIQNTIWQNRYAYNENLAKVEVDQAALNIILQILENNRGAEIQIVESHKHAYEFFQGCRKLVNVDFHHDVYEGSQKVDCGNWLRHLNPKCLWIGRADSDMPKKLGKMEFTTDLNRIAGKKFKKIFICRSNMWSPPHLDKEFLKIVHKALVTGGHINGEKRATLDRFDKQFLEGIEEQRKIFDEVRAAYEKANN